MEIAGNPYTVGLINEAGTSYSGYKRCWLSKVVLDVVSIYANSSCDPLICSLFTEEIRLVSPISMETREGPTSNSDFDWPKENTQTTLKFNKFFTNLHS